MIVVMMTMVEMVGEAAILIMTSVMAVIAIDMYMDGK